LDFLRDDKFADAGHFLILLQTSTDEKKEKNHCLEMFLSRGWGGAANKCSLYLYQKW
jgi:hypothetical protein